MQPHANAMSAGASGDDPASNAPPPWPAGWVLKDAQKTYFSELVTVGRFAGGWNLAGKCFCGLDFAKHDTVGDADTDTNRAFVCARCRCFYIKGLPPLANTSLPEKLYSDIDPCVYININDTGFTTFEYLVLQKTLALKMLLDTPTPTRPPYSAAKQYAFTDTVVDAAIETTITTNQRWISFDEGFSPTVLLDHFETFNSAITSKTCKFAFTIRGKSESIELTYTYWDSDNVTSPNTFVDVYSPGSIGKSNVYLVSVKTSSNNLYNIPAGVIKVTKIIALVAMMYKALSIEPDTVTMTYRDAYENSNTSFDVTNKIEISNSAFNATLRAGYNMLYNSSVMLLCDRNIGGTPVPQSLMPFNNENIGSCVDTMFAGIEALGEGDNVTITVSGATNPNLTTYDGPKSISEIIDIIKRDYSVATLVPGGGDTPYLPIQSNTRQSWTGANMYRTTDDPSDLQSHITDLVPKRVQESWHSGGVVLTADGTAYRAGDGNPPVLTVFDPSSKALINVTFEGKADNILIKTPTAVEWGNLTSGMSIVTDQMFWANFTASLFKEVSFWDNLQASAEANSVMNVAELPSDMVYVPAWLALQVLLKSEGLTFIPAGKSAPITSVYNIWSVISTSNNGKLHEAVAGIANMAKETANIVSTKIDEMNQVASFVFTRVREGYAKAAEDASRFANSETSAVATTDLSLPDAGKAAAGAAVAYFASVPILTASGIVTAYHYSGDAAFTWDESKAGTEITKNMHGGTFTVSPSLYKEGDTANKGLHYILSSFLDSISFITGQSLNDEIALPASILMGNDGETFREVVLGMLTGHEISQAENTLFFSRTLTNSGVSGLYRWNTQSENDNISGSRYHQTSPGNYINVGTYDATSSSFTSDSNAIPATYKDSEMTEVTLSDADPGGQLGDLHQLAPGNIAIIEPTLPPLALPRVGATKIVALNASITEPFATIGSTIQAANNIIDAKQAERVKHPANNYVTTLGNVSNLEALYSDFHSALAYVPDPTIFENNILVSMAYATCIENARNVWHSFFQTYTPNLVHTTAQMQCGIWTYANMQMLHLETEASDQIWPALQYVVDHLVANRANFGTTGTRIDLNTIIYWLDSATPLHPGEHFGANAKIWFRFGTMIPISLPLNGLSNSVMWSTTNTDVNTQITALNMYYDARLNGITESTRQGMSMFGVTLIGPRDIGRYPAPQSISLEMDSTLVSPSPTVATIPSVIHQIFTMMSVSVFCCAFYIIYAEIRTVSRTAVDIVGKTEFKYLLLRNVQPMKLHRKGAADEFPDGWTQLKDDHGALSSEFRFIVRPA